MILADWAARPRRYESGSRWPQKEILLREAWRSARGSRQNDGALLCWKETLMLLTGSLCNWAERERWFKPGECDLKQV